VDGDGASVGVATGVGPGEPVLDGLGRPGALLGADEALAGCAGAVDGAGVRVWVGDGRGVGGRVGPGGVGPGRVGPGRTAGGTGWSLADTLPSTPNATASAAAAAAPT